MRVAVGRVRYELRQLDTLRARFPYHRNHNVRYLAIKDAILSCGLKEILIVGCGKGIVEYILPEELSCVGVDINADEIQSAMEINRDKANRQFYVGDIFHLEHVLGERKFPVVVVSEVIEHLRDDQLALRSACQHLLPGGRLVLTVPNINRFHNYLRVLLGREAFLMSRDHLREYNFTDARNLLTELRCSIVYWQGIWFEFPRPYLVEKYISAYSKLRSLLAVLFPQWATYLLFVCKSSRL